jgi:hypothetical protein
MSSYIVNECKILRYLISQYTCTVLLCVESIQRDTYLPTSAPQPNSGDNAQGNIANGLNDAL